METGTPPGRNHFFSKILRRRRKHTIVPIEDIEIEQPEIRETEHDVESAAKKAFGVITGFNEWLPLIRRIDAGQIHFWHHEEVKSIMAEYPELNAFVDRDPERFNSLVLLHVNKKLKRQQQISRLRGIGKLVLVAISSTGIGAWLAMII